MPELRPPPDPCNTAAERRTLAYTALAHVALRISCHGCRAGPDEARLCATTYGREPTRFGGDVGWTMPLVMRRKGGAYHPRYSG